MFGWMLLSTTRGSTRPASTDSGDRAVVASAWAHCKKEVFWWIPYSSQFRENNNISFIFNSFPDNFFYLIVIILKIPYKAIDLCEFEF